MSQRPQRPRIPPAGSEPYRSKTFDYSVDYRNVNLRKHPELYRVGRGEQGVLMVEPYKGEILPHWRFRNVAIAAQSAAKIEQMFHGYKSQRDFVGMDMARKFLQMGYTRARRYANHASGRKYDASGGTLPFDNDAEKAAAATVFHAAWKRVEADLDYQRQKAAHKARYG
jgi:Domain of unknown function (DUF4385)